MEICYIVQKGKQLNHNSTNGDYYSGGLNTEHWNTKCYEVQIFNAWVLEWSVIAIAIAIPDHSNTEAFEVQTKWKQWIEFA